MGTRRPQRRELNGPSWDVANKSAVHRMTTTLPIRTVLGSGISSPRLYRSSIQRSVGFADVVRKSKEACVKVRS